MTVFRDYDAEALEKQYNARASIPDHPQIFQRWKEASAVARAKSPKVRLDLRFGKNPKETLDFFPAESKNPPLVMLIHGGYWRSLDKSDFSDKAQALVAAGASVAVVNYDLCPDVTVGDIMDEMRRAAAWLWHNAADLGVDRGRFQAIGHSAGGHLAAALLATDWPKYDAALPAGMVRSGVLVSGIYELEPLRHVSMHQDLRLTADQAKAWSPVLTPPPAKVSAAAVWGALETAEFRRQTEALAAAWTKAGTTVSAEAIPDRHHLNVIEDLGKTGSRLMQLSLKLLGL